MRRVAARDFNDFYVAVEVKGNEMTWRSSRVVMPHNCIDLKCTGTTVMDIIKGRADPTDEENEHCPEDKHPQHSHTEVEYRMPMAQ